MQTLDALPLGQSCRVVGITAEGNFKRRLSDLGVMCGTKITALHKSICGDPIAYAICGAVIALRRADAKTVLIKTLQEGD